MQRPVWGIERHVEEKWLVLIVMPRDKSGRAVGQGCRDVEAITILPHAFIVVGHQRIEIVRRAFNYTVEPVKSTLSRPVRLVVPFAHTVCTKMPLP